MYGFIHVYKSAGTTLNRMLRASYGSNHADVEPLAGVKQPAPFSEVDLDFVKSVYPKLAGFAGHRVKGHADFGKYSDQINLFTIVRDPIKRAASAYQYSYRYQKEQYGRELSFEEWLEDPYSSNLHCTMLCGEQSFEAAAELIEKKSIFVGLADHYYESLVMLQRSRIPELQVVKASYNVANNKSISGAVLGDATLLGKVVEANREDAKLYEYLQTSLYPKYVEEWGGSLEQAVASLPSHQSVSHKANILVNRLYRNIVYKPALKRMRRKLSH